MTAPSRAGVRYAIWAPPIAWVVQGLGSVALAATACHHPEAIGRVRAGLAALGVAALLVALLAIRTAWAARRSLSGGAPLLGDEAEARARMLASGGIFLAFTLGLGIVWALLPVAMLGRLCESVR